MFSDLSLPALTLGLSFLTSSVLAHPAVPSTADIFDTQANGAFIDPQNHLHSPHHLEERDGAAGPRVIVTGAPDGGVQPRLEIREMYNNNPSQWNLFIQAMIEFQKNDNVQLSTSYYSIAGIHGLPQQAWNGANQNANCTGPGYCTHHMAIFPGWHRAYVSLFEQEFLKVARNIALAYPAGRQRDYMWNAYRTMRFPYWDWAANPQNNAQALPAQMSDKYISYTKPSGERVNNAVNPLFRYEFPHDSKLQQGLAWNPFTSWPYTLRYPNLRPNDNNVDHSMSIVGDIISAVKDSHNSWQELVYNMFQTCQEYSAFSNENAVAATSSCSHSIEWIHDQVHTSVGGTYGYGRQGHMSVLPEAAFDPAFWLHHANVDRLFAMWQAKYPKSFEANQNTGEDSTFVIPPNVNLTMDSPLVPFQRDQWSWWTSNGLRNTEALGYTYNELIKDRTGQESVSSAIIRLYSSWNAPGPYKRNNRGFLPSYGNSTSNSTNPLGSVAAGVKHLLKTPFQALNGSMFQYVAHVHAPRFALNSSYDVFLFHGKPACEEPRNWATDPNTAGKMSIFAGPGQHHHNSYIRGSFPLTRSLTNKVHEGCLSDLSLPSVSKFMTERLTWRIASADGCSVDPKTLDGFEVGVFASTSTPLINNLELPIWSDFIDMSEVTCEKDGGARHDGKLFSSL